MKMPKLPSRLDFVSGKLALVELGNNQSDRQSRLILRQKGSNKIFHLNEGDKVVAKGNAWSANVQSVLGDEYLNGQLGMLFTRRRNTDGDAALHDSLPKMYHYFISVAPEKAEEMDKWIDALENKTEVTVHFRVPPFAEPSQKFIAAHLEPFFEQGMEYIAWCASDTQKNGYDALHTLAPGDKLVIYKQSGKGIYWKGSITSDVLQTLDNQLPKLFSGPENPTKLGGLLLQAFRHHYPAVLIKGSD